MSEKTNVWDFLIKSIPVFATLFGVLLSHGIKYIGKIKFNVDETKFRFTLDEKMNFNFDTGEPEFVMVSIMLTEITLHIYNSSDSYKTIKNIELFLGDEHLHNKKFIFNERKNTTLNIFKIPPKEVVQLVIKGYYPDDEVAKIKDSKKFLDLHLNYENRRGKEKSKKIYTIDFNEIEDDF